MSNSNFLSENAYSYLIRLIAIKMKLSADEKVTELGLNSQQGSMIHYIYEHQDSGIIQKDLADIFHRRGASITSMLQGLEKKGYIERITAKDNGREKNIYVLPKGADLIQEFNKAFDEVEQSITNGLTEEEKTSLLSLLIKVNNNL